MSAIDAVFFKLLAWCAISLALLALGALLCWRCRRPIERLRSLQMTFLAVALAFGLQFVPLLPRWNLGWFFVNQESAERRNVADGANTHSRGANPATAVSRLSSMPDFHDGTASNSLSESPKALRLDETTPSARAMELQARPTAPQAEVQQSTFVIPDSAVPSVWMPWLRAALLAVFAAGAGTGIFSFGCGIWRLRRLLKSSQPAGAEIMGVFQEFARDGLRPVDIRTSPEVDIPITFGLFRPVIVLPHRLAGDDAHSTLRFSLAHEWCHVRNHDVAQWWAVQCLQPLVWFQPLYWHLAREMRICQDQLADWFATETAGDPLAYADLLVRFARQHRYPRTAAALAMAQGRSKLARRVVALLDENRHGATICRRPLMGALSVAVMALAVTLGLIDFRHRRGEIFLLAADSPAAAAQAESSNPDHPPVSPPAAAANEVAKFTAQAGFDIDGDPLPPGVVARLGTKRFRPNRGEAKQIAFLSDGKTLGLLTSDGWLQYWDSATGSLLRELQLTERWVFTAAFSTDGRFAALQGNYVDEDRHESIGFVILADTVTGQPVMKMEAADWQSEKLAVSPDGKTVACNGDKVHLIDVASGAEVLSRQFPDRQIDAINFSPDGKTLAVAGTGKTFLWNWTTTDEPTTISIRRESRWRNETLIFSPDGAQLTIGHSVYGTANGKLIRKYELPDAGDNIGGIHGFSPDGKLVAAPVDSLNSGGGVAVWEAASGKYLRTLHGNFGTAACLSISPDGRKLAAGCGWDNTLCVWDIATGNVLGIERPGHVQPPNSLKFFDSDTQLASAGDDATIRIWSLADSHERRFMRHEPDERGITHMMRAMDVSPDGRFVASSGNDDTVRLWEAKTGREIYRLPGHGIYGGYRALRFTSDGKQFVSWGDDMRVNVWDVATGKAVQEYRAQPEGVQLPRESEIGSDRFSSPQLEGGFFSPDAKSLTVMQGDIRRFEVATGKELSKIARQGNLTIGSAISPDNRYLISASWGRGREIPLKDGRTHFTSAKHHPVELRTLADGQLAASIDLAGGGAGPTAFSPDSRTVAIAVGDERPRIELRRAPDLVEMDTIELPSKARAVEFSKSGKLLAASVVDCTVLVWDLEHLPKKANP